MFKKNCVSGSAGFRHKLNKLQLRASQSAGASNPSLNGCFLVCSADSAKKVVLATHEKKEVQQTDGNKLFVQQPPKERKKPNTGIKDVSSLH